MKDYSEILPNLKNDFILVFDFSNLANLERYEPLDILFFVVWAALIIHALGAAFSIGNSIMGFIKEFIRWSITNSLMIISVALVFAMPAIIVELGPQVISPLGFIFIAFGVPIVFSVTSYLLFCKIKET